MLNKLVFLLSLMVLSAPAFAGGDRVNKPYPNPDPWGGLTVSNSTSSASAPTTVQSIAQTSLQSTNSVAMKNTEQPVHTAYAAMLTSSNDTCMGSSSAGAQGVAVGLSFGTTWSDEHCKTLKAATLLYNMGLQTAALARLCMDDNIREALVKSGTFDCLPQGK